MAPPSAPPPSIFPPSTVQHVASSSLSLTNLKESVAASLAADVEHRIRLLLQDAEKFMRHSRRSKLTTEDIKRSLEIKGMEPVYGYLPGPYANGSSSSGYSAPHFRRVMTNAGVVYQVEEEEIDLDALAESISSKQAKLPRSGGVGWKAHWLSIEGVQPLVPENPSPAEILAAASQSIGGLDDSEQTALSRLEGAVGSSTSGAVAPLPAAANGVAAKEPSAPNSTGTINAQSQPLVKHVLSRELQVYYRRLTEAIMHGVHLGSTSLSANGTDGQGDSAMAAESSNQDGPGSALEEAIITEVDPTSLAALSSLRSDPGLHQLIPYLSQWISSNVSASLALPPSNSANRQRAQVVSRMISASESLLLNPNLGIEGYVHLLLPPLLSCILISLPSSIYPTFLRIKAATLLSHVLGTYSSAYPSLKPRITRVLLQAAFRGVSTADSSADGSEGPDRYQDDGEDMPVATIGTKLGAIIALHAAGGGMTRSLIRARANKLSAQDVVSNGADDAAAGAGGNEDASGGYGSKFLQLGEWSSRQSPDEQVAELVDQVRLLLHSITASSSSSSSSSESADDSMSNAAAATERLPAVLRNSFWADRFKDDAQALKGMTIGVL